MSTNEGCLTQILKLFGRSQETPRRETRLSYQTRDSLLTPAEVSFYHVLLSVVGDQYVVCPKVGLKDFLYIAEQYRSKEYYRQFGRIAQKHVDFLICERGSMGPILAIELDDSSHKRQSRSERDSFVDRVFTVAGLPVLHIPARTAYNTQALAETIQPFMKQSPPVYPG